MGIADRHYVRDQPPGGIGSGGGVGGAMRTFSANTWIIILCVAVFVIDGMMAPTLVPAHSYLFQGITQMPQDATPDFERGWQWGPHGFRVVPLLDQPGGSQIGWTEVYLMQPIQAMLHFSTQRGFLSFEFWRLIGFQFLHANMMHLLFNMIALFFFGPLIERQLGSKRYVAFYLLCGIFGALLYTMLNLGGNVATMVLGEEVRLPGLLFNSPYTPLIGASAGVFGVLMAGAYLAPRATVLLFFIIPMPFWLLAYGLVALALLTLITGGHNAGGEAGHLGGAMAGWYFIRHQRHLHGFFDFLGRADPTSHHYRNRQGKARGGIFRRSPAKDTREVDRILDKISTHGLHSLTDEEKRTLREASSERR